MRAYNESYLNDAKNNLADFFDYAVRDCKLNPDSFIQLFIQSGYADKFERGNPSVISGMSGTELARAVLSSVYPLRTFPEKSFSRNAPLFTGQDGHWQNINGVRANGLKIFFPEFPFQKLFPCILYITKWI